MITKYMDKDTTHRKICGVDMVELAEKYGTPLYVLFEELIESNYKQYQTALNDVYKNHLICYAVKANTTFAILKLLGELGAGADVASEYELQFALDAGIQPAKIRANGNCKSKQYLVECIKNGILINVDPEEELDILNETARELGMTAKINLRLAGFPLKHITSPAITTSSEWSKFGIPVQRAKEALQKVLRLDHLIPNGLMVHLGSQITDMGAYHLVLNELIKLAADADKIGFDVKEINIGGGCGISYLGKEEWNAIKRKIADTNDATWANELIGYNCNNEWVSEELYCPFTPDTFIQKLFNESYTANRTFKERLEAIGVPKIVVEPGRSLVGNAQVTLVKVCHVGATPSGQNIVHVDAGVNHHSQNIFVPEQLHRMEIANDIDSDASFETFIAGNLCYTGDLLCRIKNRLNGKPERGDYIIIYDTGAYSDFFASNTNSFPRPAKVMVTKAGKDGLLVKRESLFDVFHRDVDWKKRNK
uniref:Diaminopimelate decarboxylase n=1 Tax=Candidatus Methanophaga sp. ANME-1 ERB7 TaxID=2759913 RepID=A0A7G9Z2M7_9EURY|nr:diaminopimelate decarboxylase [Methanosarcinales archaeon ANME-1 ERB7]